MSIVDTLYILWKADVSGVKKGNAEVQRSTEKTKKSLNDTENSLKKVQTGFEGLARSLIGYAASIAGATAIIFNIKAATEYSIAIGNLSRQLGVSVENLDAWGNAIRQSGGTAEEFQSSLRSLAEHLNVSPDSALKLMPQFADAFQKLNRVNAFRYGHMFGLSDNTILFLKQGRREVQELIQLQKELGTVTKKDTDISFKFNTELQKTETVMRLLFVNLSTKLLPYLTKFLDLIIPAVEYLREHVDLIKGAAIGLAVVGGVLLAPFIAANAAILTVVASITTLIGLFAIAYEDVKAFLAGNDSLTADLLKKWPLIGEVIKDTLGLFKELFDGTVDFIKFIAGIGGVNVSPNLLAGQNAIGAADSNYFNSQSSNSIYNSRGGDRNSSFTTGDITINTQATDATGISKTLGKSLQDHLRYSNSFFDDGVKY